MSDEPQDEGGSKTITIGSVERTVHELSGKVYDECVELARVEKNDAYPFGIDTHRQLLFMAEKAVTPKMTIAEINDLPFTKRGMLFDAVNEVHYGAPTPLGKEEKAQSA